MNPTKYVIIGASAAGISAAETLRRTDPTGEITVISDEAQPLYSRPLISYFLAGELEEEALEYRPPDFFEKLGIEAQLGRRVERVDPPAKAVALEDGTEIRYDRLLIATGAAPKLPQVEGMDKEGVFGFRTLEDARRILQRLPRVEKAVVLGGGLVGLKAAAGLKARGVEVTVAVGSPHLLSQMVDAGAAEIYRELLEAHGIRVRTRMREEAVLGGEEVEGVRFASGEKLECQLLIAGKGVAANMAPVEGTQIQREYGILTDERCRTNLEDIYAAGDVAQTHDVVRGQMWTNALWPCAVEQGRVAALNMAGVEAVYQGSMGMNSVQFFDLPVISAGLAGLRETDYDEELVSRRGRRYRRLLLRGNRLVGFALVGDVAGAGVIRSLIEAGVDVSPVRDELLRPDFGFAHVMPLLQAQPEAFAEEEYQKFFEILGEAARAAG